MVILTIIDIYIGKGCLIGEQYTWFLTRITASPGYCVEHSESNRNVNKSVPVCGIPGGVIIFLGLWVQDKLS